MKDTIIDRVELRVRDLRRTVQFYEDVIGLRCLGGDDSRADLGIPESPEESLLVLHESSDAPARRSDEAGLFHIAFRVPTEEALADALRRIRERGVQLTGASNHEISHALYLNDPEGNGLEIYCDQPREQWPMDEQGRLELATRRLDLDSLLEREPTDTPERFPRGTDVGHIHLEGTDIGDAHGFYAQLLGLHVTVETSSVLFTADGDYHHHIGVNQWRGRRRPRADESLGLVSVAARVPVDGQTLMRRIDNAGLSAVSGDKGLEVRDGDNIRWRLRPA